MRTLRTFTLNITVVLFFHLTASAYQSGFELYQDEDLDSLIKEGKYVDEPLRKKSSSPSKSVNNPNKNNALTKTEVNNSRISFIFGVGAAGIFTRLYQDPIVDKTTNFVKISRADAYKTGLSLGIVYTPWLYTFEDEPDNTFAAGISYALFISPSTIGSIGNNLTKANVDAGFGVGWRTVGGFSVFGVVDFFSLRQPRQFFIDTFKDGGSAYTINGQTQSSIDINDNSIFYDKLAISLGIKFCYTFDIIKSYQKSTE